MSAIIVSGCGTNYLAFLFEDPKTTLMSLKSKEKKASDCCIIAIARAQDFYSSFYFF